AAATTAAPGARLGVVLALGRGRVGRRCGGLGVGVVATTSPASRPVRLGLDGAGRLVGPGLVVLVLATGPALAALAAAAAPPAPARGLLALVLTGGLTAVRLLRGGGGRRGSLLRHGPLDRLGLGPLGTPARRPGRDLAEIGRLEQHPERRGRGHRRGRRRSG